MFDDVLDVFDVILAADTYDSLGRPIYRAADLAKNSGAGQIARGYGPISWGLRGADYVFNDLHVIDLPPALRDQLRLEAEQAKAGAFTGDLLPDESGDVAGAVARAFDDSEEQQRANRVVTGVFDP